MALNTFNKIPATAEKITQSSARSKTAGVSQSNTRASFADIMAKEQSTNNAAAQATKRQPVVARLPEVTSLPLRTAFAGRTPNDMLRMQNFNKAGNDLAQTRAMESFMQSASGTGTLDIARGMNAANNLRIVASGNNGKGFALNNSDFIRTQNI